ncbi:hypothetical protein K435DRAFT_867276 [Dendrothele bispora CBS 962.96]|uniref:Uncharacterized protein n=1 Tax=Dendrothele bispora (strain CBS 962.96) TaxID=1314807 RepID=A0A4V4HDM2_DENBC|nr:hypothetical protein K435DRAFT_867276 [Dendrothele bispora CBS 962.96]
MADENVFTRLSMLRAKVRSCKGAHPGMAEVLRCAVQQTPQKISNKVRGVSMQKIRTFVDMGVRTVGETTLVAATVAAITTFFCVLFPCSKSPSSAPAFKSSQSTPQPPAQSLALSTAPGPSSSPRTSALLRRLVWF